MVPRSCGKRIGHFDESLGTLVSRIAASHDEKTRGSEREQCMFDDELALASSYVPEFFLTLTCTNATVMLNFWNFHCSFDLLKTLSEFLAIYWP